MNHTRWCKLVLKITPSEITPPKLSLHFKIDIPVSNQFVLFTYVSESVIQISKSIYFFLIAPFYIYVWYNVHITTSLQCKMAVSSPLNVLHILQWRKENCVKIHIPFIPLKHATWLLLHILFIFLDIIPLGTSEVEKIVHLALWERDAFQKYFLKIRRRLSLLVSQCLLYFTFDHISKTYWIYWYSCFANPFSVQCTACKLEEF